MRLPGLLWLLLENESKNRYYRVQDNVFVVSPAERGILKNPGPDLDYRHTSPTIRGSARAGLVSSDPNDQ